MLARTRALVAERAPELDFVEYEFDGLDGQRAAFARARVVIGTQGTAFSGLAFATPGRLRAVIEWAFLRADSWEAFSYLGLGDAARYFQLMPRWSSACAERKAAAVPAVPTMLAMDDCEWTLARADVGAYLGLLAEALRDGGRALTEEDGERRGRAANISGARGEMPQMPRTRTIKGDCQAVLSAMTPASRQRGRCGPSDVAQYRAGVFPT